MQKKFNTSGLKLPQTGIGLGLFFCIIFWVDLKPGSPQVTYTAAIAILMAFWWVTEAIPIGATSLLPIILFPALGVVDGKAISNTYINYVIFLFIGGFIMALAIERWELHKRIALKILSTVGGSPFRILFGFMLASGFLSMWMSNTATAMMMLPIALSVTGALEEVYSHKKVGTFAIGLLLCIAYGCSIGGIATLVGTPPNLSFVRIFEIIFPTAPEISFGQWLLFALPLSACMFVITLFYLYLIYKPKEQIESLGSLFFREKYYDLGPTTREQKKVLVLFLLLIFLWVFRKDLVLGEFVIPGWSRLFDHPEFLNDGTVAIFVALLLFLIPGEQKGEALINWGTVRRIPWRIVLLFGGGFALAKGFIESGLSEHIGSQLVAAKEFSLISLIGTLTAIMSGLTEFTSNTATAEMMLPVISGLAVEIRVNPLLLMLPITLAASMAFMFPIATPPNAIIFGSGRISMLNMLKTGFFLNLIAITLISLFTYYWATFVFGLDLAAFPDWGR
jgi:sodium-dependent dicarboxylate transporter 2/3/5